MQGVNTTGWKIKVLVHHCFSTEANVNYTGLFPASEFYGVDQMSERQKQEFEIWYISVMVHLTSRTKLKFTVKTISSL